jgi:predicted RNA-binding protein with PUA-like domain
MPGIWLIKSEPSTYSFADLQRDSRTRWDGVSNATALIHLRGMRNGDEVLFYHSGAQRAIVGIARVASDPYSDPGLQDPKRVAVDLIPIRRLEHPISLRLIKGDRRLAMFPLVRISRLSVMPVLPAERDAIFALR